MIDRQMLAHAIFPYAERYGVVTRLPEQGLAPDAILGQLRAMARQEDGVISKHESGISVLAEPQKIDEGVSISSSEIKKVLSLLKSMYKYIIIDAETISDRTTTAIEMADMILLVFFMSLPSIKNMQRHLKYFERLGFGKDRVKLIANRYLKKGDITIQDTEKALSYPIFFTLPNDYDTAMTCLNKGVPISEGAPRTQLNASLKELSKAIIS